MASNIDTRAAEEVRPLVLVVDDDHQVAELLAETLRSSFEAHALHSAADALAFIAEHDVAIVLADHQMPGTDGLQLLAEARIVQPTSVGVLITGHADVDAAIQAINSARVLGFLTKPWDESELMLVMQRAMDAHRALVQLSRASQEPERELRVLERFAEAAPVPVTARGFGALPLREALPDVFADLTAQYVIVLGHALEQRVFKVDHHTTAGLHAIADRLGRLDAGPRDVIDVHLEAMKQRLAESGGAEGAAIAEEGRLLVLELMGHVVTYYRNHTLGMRR